jgi:glucose/arabinose dehydrogenase
MHVRPIALLAPFLLTAPLAAQVTTKLIAGGLTRPLWAGAPAGDERLFIAQKGGLIRILANGQILATPFLSLLGKISTGDEQGLLGVAFHPDYVHNGFFYVDYTDTTGDTVLSRFHVSADPNVADPASELVLLNQNQPFANHNGGDLHFGPNDGYLYVFFGDGGSANDPACRAQKLTNLLGKALRIDVDSGSPYAIPPTNPFFGQTGVRQEIFHYGLRNPWRNGFDRLTGDLYIGDVGQDTIEEIDVAPAGSAGLDFGWKLMEGTRCNQTSNCDTGTPPCNDPGYVLPITELTHAGGSTAITGGYVYRGCQCPSEYGKYFFSDFGDHKIRSLEYDVATGTVSNLTDRTADFEPGGGLLIRNIASFGEDGFGELLVIDNAGNGLGEVFKMVPAGANAAVNAMRNGSGANRLCLTGASLPILGSNWEARVDTSGHPGATLTALFGYAAPGSGSFLGRNEILVDRASALRFQLVQASTGSTDVFRAPIPCRVSLAGQTLYVQAAILGGGLELCNALDVTPGYY